MIMSGSTDTAGSDARGIAGQAGDDAWTGWLRQYKSAETKAGYRREAVEWATWLTARGRDLHVVRPADVATWMDALRSRELAEATVARKVAAVLSYYRWAKADGLLEVVPQPEKLPKVHTDPVRRLGKPVEEVAALLAAAAPGRELALVTLLAHTGVRVSEATNADVTAVQRIQGQRVLKVTGKGGKPRTPVLTDEAWPAIAAYLDGRRAGALFLGARTDRMSRKEAWRIVHRLGEQVGVRMHPHLFRHSAAVLMARDGASIKQIAVALGHADIKTTAVYLEGLAALEDSPAYGLSRLLAEAAAVGPEGAP